MPIRCGTGSRLARPSTRALRRPPCRSTRRRRSPPDLSIER
jgi:hypothetical protein